MKLSIHVRTSPGSHAGVGFGTMFLLAATIGAASEQPCLSGEEVSKTDLAATLLIEPDALAKRLKEPKMRILDSRSKADYLKSHIPGAAWVDVAKWQALGTTEGGFHDTKAWGALVGGLGIDHDTHVVVYGTSPPNSSRIWWTLRYLGLKNALLLDGGWAGWMKAKQPVETASPTTPAVSFKPSFQADLLEEIDSMKEVVKAGKVKIVDTRSRDEFTGKVVKGKRGGHIPGAILLEWKELLAEDGRFKTPAQLRELFKKRGIEPGETTICY